ncbi:glycosyltransferase family 9 protein [Microbacterium sp. LRZ72]|uniref:glycosyltransferase family 9 protein n=1 Tax=Microbacterium sp. LRZ72 TaxID=2942481 RepID=UPI0029A22A44|nr:glycosyltransferase family 9 protein [Microbacterium sp. LRZ72]MDX2376738.1 glycosyltransferase family 9 protein [Microbacterium sp. LRZ72]
MQPLREPDGRPEVLALRALKLGDLLVAVPAIHGLRRAFPHHRLVLAVPGWLEPVVDLVPGVDALLATPGLDDPLPLAPRRVDVAVNLHGSGSESRRLVDALEARLTIAHRVDEIDHGAGADPRMPAWRDDLSERERWVRLLNAYGVEADADEVRLTPPPRRSVAPGAAVLHVGAFYGSRRWPVDRFAAVAHRLRRDGHRVVFTGSADERERALAVARAAGMDDEAVLAGRLDLTDFAAVIEGARVVVSADTGAAHLASAYRRPSVVLFGPATPEQWGPPPGPHLALTDARVRRGDAFADTPDPALLAVGVEDVLWAIRAVLAPASA